MFFVFIWIGCAVLGYLLMKPHGKQAEGAVISGLFGPFGVIGAAIWRSNLDRAAEKQKVE